MAHIEYRRQRNPIGLIETEEFIWVAEPGEMTAWVSHSMLSDFDAIDRPLPEMTGRVVRLGGLRLRVIDFDYSRHALEVAPDGFRAASLAVIKPRLRTLDLIYRRLIITAAVWHLAAYSEMTVPTYDHLYAVKWLKRKIAKLKARFKEVEGA